LSPRTDREGNPVSSRPPPRPAFRDRGPPRGGLGERRGAPKVEAGSTDFKGAPVFVEAARAKAQFVGRAVLDESLYSPRAARMLGWPAHLPPPTPALLCKAANALAARVLAREMQYFAGLAEDCDRVAAFYRELSNRLARAGERTCLISLGFGAGWHRISFGAALADMPAIDPIDFRAKFRLAAHRLRSRFPKTRRLVMETFAVPRCPPGWVEIEFA
jgi:hypothetical protein